MEQRLVAWQAFPVVSRAVDDAALRWVVGNDLAAQPHDDVLVATKILLLDELAQLALEQGLVDVHEKASDVEFQHIGILGVAVAALVHETGDAADAVERSLSGAATVAVVDEQPLEKRVEAADNVVVHDAVAEVGGKHLAQLGPTHDEGDARRNAVTSLVDVVAQLHKVMFVIQLKLQCALAVALRAAALEIGLKQVFQLHLAIGVLHEKGRQPTGGRCRRSSHTSHTTTVVLVVVVVVVVVQLTGGTQVPRVVGRVLGAETGTWRSRSVP